MSAPDNRDNEDGGFLSRWSRRKLRTESETPVAPPVQAIESAEPDNRPRDPETGEVIDDELVARLPKVDELQAGGDLSPFMQKGVPEALRREALRTMWLNDPLIRNYVSPALDYAYDYNAPGGAPGYGPLTESDMANAREFLANVFSTPQKAADQDENAQESGSRDNESHILTESAPAFVRQSDVAVQHGQGPAVTSYLVDDIRELTDASEKPQNAEVAVVQRSMADSAAPDLKPLRRRRGGGAAPV